MSLVLPAHPDALRPTEAQALSAWSARVQADREQVERLRELADPSDFYAPMAGRFRVDPRRSDDDVLAILRSLARPQERWLDIGAGAGRYALPMALDGNQVTAVEPSEAMRGALGEGMREHGVGDIRVVDGRWPPAGWPADASVLAPFAADVALMAHIGYDIEAIGPFLDAAEAAAARLCVAVAGEGAMTTVATLFWGPVHGEPRVPLPALPELLTLLIARGRLPQVRLADRVPPTFDSPDELLDMARRQLWLRPGSVKDARLRRLVDARASERQGRWALEWDASHIGVVSWQPHPPR